jgi:hypothetical protein
MPVIGFAMLLRLCLDLLISKSQGWVSFLVSTTIEAHIDLFRLPLTLVGLDF